MKQKRWQETALYCFMTLGIPYALVWLGLIVLPSYHSSIVLTPIICVHVFLGLYLVSLVLINFNKVIRTDTRCQSPTEISASSEPGLPVCSTCNITPPPRSYHCRVCGCCIERRDHHCLFTGCCVGRTNHRFFIAGVLAVFTGALYGVVYEWDMVVDVCGGYSLWLPLQMTAPHLTAPFGLLTAWGFVVCSHHMLGIAVLANAGFLLYVQLAAVLRGQTQYDRKHAILRYDRGWRDNLRTVLGERWLLALLWPFAESPLLPDIDGSTDCQGTVGGTAGSAGDGDGPKASDSLIQRKGTSAGAAE